MYNISNFIIWYLTDIDEATLRTYVMVSLCKHFPCAIVSGVKIVGVFIQIFMAKRTGNLDPISLYLV